MLLHPERQQFKSEDPANPGLTATWTRSGAKASVMFIRRPNSAEEAYRLADPHRRTPTPAVQPGTISFDPERYPDLETCREWFPSLDGLWDAVKEELRDQLLQSAKASSRDHVCGGGGRYGDLA